MGAYLSAPIVEKVSSDEKYSRLSYGSSSMQGWRVFQEDAHNCIIDFDTDTSLFAVYDGHGGAEVAKYCSLNLPDYIRSVTNYKKGNLNQALEDAFLEFDSTLVKPEVLADLKRYAEISDGDESEDDTKMLHEEADMPLDKVLERYHGDELSATSFPHRLAPHLLSYHKDKPKSPQLYAKKRSKEPSIHSLGQENHVTNSSDDTFHEARDSNQEEAVSSVNGVSSTEKMIPLPTNSSQAKIECEDSSAQIKVSKDDKSSACVISFEAADGQATSSVSGSGSAIITVEEDVSSLSGSKDCDEVSSTTLNGKESQNQADKALEDVQPGCSNTVTSSSSTSADSMMKNKERESRGPIEWSSDESQEDDEDFSGASESETSEEESSEEDSGDESPKVDFGEGEEPGLNSGCTSVVALVKGNQLFVANAGDSRCVVCRNGEALDMSVDHKPEDEVERDRIYKAGGRVTSDGRVNGGLNLSRAIGDHSYKDNPELSLKEQMITALPDVKEIILDGSTDQFMVLACDGIWNSMSSQEVIDFVKERLEKTDKLSTICEQLFDHCLAPDSTGDGTGCDNMTAIIIRFHELPLCKESISGKRSAQDKDGNDIKRPKLDQ